MSTIWECAKVLAFEAACLAGLFGAAWVAIQVPDWARSLWAHEKRLRGMR